MVLFRCPRCEVQVSVANNSGDFIHQCNSGQASVDQEDVKIIGRWTDFTGSDFGLRTSPDNVQWQDVHNKLMGTEAWVRENAKTTATTIRGANANTHRQRQHLEYIKNENKG